MSLKAKIEAVIYASEEPVTLAQLVGLLGQEAQADLDREDAAQQTLSLNETEAELEAAAEADPTIEDGAAPAENGFAPAENEPVSAEDAEVPEVSAETEAAANAVAEGKATSAATEAVAAKDAAAAAKVDRARAVRLRAYFRTELDRLIQDYATPERGLEIREVAGGFRFGTKPEYHDAVRGFVKSLKPPLKLSLQALETLAVVAYKQPVTAPEVGEIRGVDSGGVLGSLMARKLVTTAGRKQVIGRPILYKTTKEFLLKFGLKDLAELPSIEEFEKMAGQMAEQEEIPMSEPDNRESLEAREYEEAREPVEHHAPETIAELEVEGDAYSPQADGESAPADNVSEETGDKASVDGRIASLPSDYDDGKGDPSADEAEIQRDELQGEE